MTEHIPTPDASQLVRLEPHTPGWRQAVAEFNASVGYDIRTVLSDSHWFVASVNGARPDVLVSAEGMRAMARFAPRPDAAEVVEQIIAQGRRSR